ncbi:MAG: glutamate formimidoyltransferase [Eubacteriales bacterium]|nr:glutamate formimidoyltransferase [Eubacteriales bacterium]
MKRLLAEVNISEGRDHGLINLVQKALAQNEVEIIDVDSEPNHNRTVFTYIGAPGAVLQGTKDLTAKAIELIDMTMHTGSHPRMGAVDVVPFIPIKDMTIEETVEISREFGKFLGSLGVPVYYYEDAATRPERANLVSIRKGQYEALSEKMKHEEWRPDEGPFEFVPKSGATVTGVRFPLIAFNVNLRTDDIELGKKIVKAVRGATGGYQFVRAIALPIEESKMIQISMNLTNYAKTPIHRVFETVKSEAMSYGVQVAGTELVGPVPLDALKDVLDHYLQAHHFSMEQIYI